MTIGLGNAAPNAGTQLHIMQDDKSAMGIRNYQNNSTD